MTEKRLWSAIIKLDANLMNPNYKTKVWICVLTAVPQGSILVYFMIYVVIGKENRSAKITTRRTDGPNAIFCKKPFPQKMMLGFMWLHPMCAIRSQEIQNGLY